MPSKKKNKSKGRGKSAKKAGKQGGSLDTQMEQLKIDKDVEDAQTNADEDALLEEAIKLAAAEKEEMDAAASEKEEEQLKVCHHGKNDETKELICFIKMFTETFSTSAAAAGQDSILIANLAVATKAVAEKYPDVWYDTSKMKLVVNHFLCNGTQHVLQGDFIRARLTAAMASYLETFIVFRSGKKMKQNWAEILELCNCEDEHTLVKYLRKRIPCTCLDEKYKEVKSTARMGVCFNCTSAVCGAQQNVDLFSMRRRKLLLQVVSES